MPLVLGVGLFGDGVGDVQGRAPQAVPAYSLLPPQGCLQATITTTLCLPYNTVPPWAPPSSCSPWIYYKPAILCLRAPYNNIIWIQSTLLPLSVPNSRGTLLPWVDQWVWQPCCRRSLRCTPCHRLGTAVLNLLQVHAYTRVFLFYCNHYKSTVKRLIILTVNPPQGQKLWSIEQSESTFAFWMSSVLSGTSAQKAEGSVQS